MADSLRDQLETALGSTHIIDRELSGGGMARLFVAEESSLGRKVVVKVLPPDATAEVGVERFDREMRLAASLQHPNIVPVLASGSFGDLRYYTMPFVEGESLRQHLQRAGPLPLDEVVKVARDVADALQYAHDSGIVHRDVKPENVMLSRGHALVTDFGIARASSGTHAAVTKTGISMGTPAYMSPEQFYAESAVDSRADVFALGCVVYEMVTGEAPCGAARSPMQIARHLLDPPPRASARRSGITSRLDDVLARAMARESADRYASASELIAALTEAVGVSTIPPPARVAERAVAVLPFASLSSDPENEFFATGLADEIITDLGRVHGMRVTARGSSMRYKGSDKDARGIARELGVQFLLEGSVRRAGNSLRVIAELVDAERDAQVWSERFTGTLDDVFEIQEQIARQIVSALELRLTPEDERRLARRSIENVQAHEMYLRARQLNWLFTEAGVRKGLELADAALKLEPDSPPLLALKGSLVWNALNVGLADEGSLAEAMALADRALQADPNLGQALVVRALVEALSPTVDSALVLKLLRRAADEDASTEAMAWLAVFLSQTGRPELGFAYGERARELDPLSPIVAATAAFALAFMGRFEEAIARTRAILEREPDDPMTRMFYATFCASAGEFDEALREFTHLRADGIFEKLRILRVASLSQDAAALAAAASDPGLRHYCTVDDQTAWLTAHSLAHGGDVEQAMEVLRLAVGRGFSAARFVREFDQMLVPLRSHPDFGALTARMEAQALEIAKASGF